MRFLKTLNLMGLLLWAPEGAADVNNPNVVAEPGEVWPEGELPSQGGGGSTLMPGQSSFILPATLAQQWDTIDIEDKNPKSKNFGKVVRRLRLKFTKEAPLVVADGPHKGETLTATFTSNPRPRGKADDEKTPWISDLAYMLDIGLADKSRPTSAEVLKQTINRYAGKTVRIEHGLSAHCRPDAVRYIADPSDPTGMKTMQDPTGAKGCGDDKARRADNKGKKGRYYTKDFKDPTTGEYQNEVECLDCPAILRGFPSVERFLPPLGGK